MNMDELRDTVARLERLFQEALGRKANGYELTTMRHTAAISARAILAADDMTVKPNDVIRLANCARKARVEMFKVFKQRDRELKRKRQQ